MLLQGACFFLLSGILFGSFVAQINGAPVTYDQRQTGDLNVDAKLENFLVIVATSGSNSMLNNLASMLQINELVVPRNKQRERSQQKASETMVYETENADEGREPYHVEIVHIEKDGDNADGSKLSDPSPNAKSSEKIELGTPSSKIAGNSEISQETSEIEVSIDNKKAAKKTRSLWKSDAHRLEEKRPMHIGNSQIENMDHPDDLPVKEEASKGARPGISLKKQLSKKEEEDVSEERNELGNRYQELVLLGGGIENCGPGRYRDKLGVCQHDKNFN